MTLRSRLCLAAFFVILAITPHAPAEPIKPGPDTTVITQPLRDDGTVDYLAALNREMAQGVKAEDNAFAGIADLMGGAEWAWPNPEHLRLVYEQLGKPIPDEDQAAFVPIEAFAKARGKDPDKASDQLYKATDQPWNPEEFPLVDAWLNHNAAALDRLAAVVRGPGYFSPLVCEADRPQTIKAAFLPTLGFYRELGHALHVRINRARGRGDTGQAVDDLLLLLRLSRLPGKQLQNISALVGISLSAMSREAMVGLLNDPHLKPADLGRLAKGMKRLPPLPSIAPVVKRGERFAALDMVQQLQRGEFKAFLWDHYKSKDFYEPILQQVKPFLTSPAYDVNSTLRLVNRQFDAMPLAEPMPSYAAYRAANTVYEFGLDQIIGDRFDREVGRQIAKQATASPNPETRNRLSRFVEDLAVVSLVPGKNFIVETDQQARMFERLLFAAVGVKQYQLEHGRFPDELPEPVTDFDGLPVVYRVEPNRVLIYSVGTDLKDDGGVFNPEAGGCIEDLPIELTR